MSRSSRADCVVGSAGAIGPAGVHGSADVSDTADEVGACGSTVEVSAAEPVGSAGGSDDRATGRDLLVADGPAAGTIVAPRSWVFATSVCLHAAIRCVRLAGRPYDGVGYQRTEMRSPTCASAGAASASSIMATA